MAAAYPDAIKTFTNPASGNTLNSPSHADQHIDENNEITAIQTELGIQPKGTATTVKARLDLLQFRRQGHTYAIPGDIKVPSGDTDFICPFFVSLGTAQVSTIQKIRYRINSGTSATFKLQKNGTDMTGFTAIVATTTATSTTATAIAVATDDMIALVVTAVSGSPKNLSATIFIDS